LNNGNPQRLIAIDRLRTGCMCVVMFGHALLPYLTVPRRFKDPEAHLAFDWIAVFLYAFAMQTFFVTAGFAAAALFVRRGPGAFWRNRWLRIGVPLLVGYIVLTPLVRCAEQFAQAVVADGSLAAGWAVIQSGDWIRHNKLYHLWFLASLLLYSALTIGGLRVRRSLPEDTVLAVDKSLGRALRSPFAGVWLGLIAALPTSLSYIRGDAPGTDAAMQATGLLFFAIGWWLYANKDILRLFAKHVALHGWLAIAITPICVWSTRKRLFDADTADAAAGIVAGLSNALIAGLVTVAMLGWFYRRFNQPSAVGDYLSAASYWIYLVHYPIVIAAGGLVAVLPVNAPLKYLAAVTIAVPTIFATYHLSRIAPRLTRFAR